MQEFVGGVRVKYGEVYSVIRMGGGRAKYRGGGSLYAEVCPVWWRELGGGGVCGKSENITFPYHSDAGNKI